MIDDCLAIECKTHCIPLLATCVLARYDFVIGSDRKESFTVRKSMFEIYREEF